MDKIIEKCLNNKKTCGAIILAIIIVIILSIVFTKKSSSTPEPTTSASYNKPVVDAAIASSGIKTTTDNFQNNFQNNLVYDSADKIKQNFTAFMNTYYPNIDINKMNQMLKEDYGINKTIQEIINDHPDVYLTNYLIQIAGLSGFYNMTLDNPTDTILSGLGYITIMKLTIPENTYDLYYLNDYDQVKDFVVYYIPPSFDKTKITNTNNEIEFIETRAGNSSLYLNKPYKVGFNNKNKDTIIKSIVRANEKMGKTVSSITEPDINNFLNIFKANKDAILKYVRLTLIAPFIKLHINTNLTDSSKVISDLIDLFTPNKYFNSDITPYLPSVEETNLSSMYANYIFSDQVQSNNNTYVPPTTSAISINIAPTAPADTTDTNIIKLYSEENFAGSVQNFDIRSATDKNDNTYKLSVYDSSSGSPPPKSYKIIQPLNDDTHISNYRYTVSLSYIYTDNSQFNINMRSVENVSIIPSTMDSNLLDGTKITRTLKNIFVYIETLPTPS
jgi:hypothetical protein